MFEAAGWTFSEFYKEKNRRINEEVKRGAAFSI
jgi:hypothetical protein